VRDRLKWSSYFNEAVYKEIVNEEEEVEAG